jgi:taurine dioxygenase
MGGISLKTEPLSPTIGAEILGVDLSTDLDEDAIAQIRASLLKFGVIFFRGQHLTPARQVAFAKKFSEPEVHPIVQGTDEFQEVIHVVKPANEPASFGTDWHQDNTFFEAPSLGTILCAEKVPPCGGDTLFADMTRAYESLSDGMKNLLGGLSAIHSAKRAYDPAGTAGPKYRGEATLKYKLSEAVEDENIHPVVRTHPETGEKSLFVNEMFTIRFDGMTEAESQPLLQYLYQHCIQPEYTCRFRWTDGAVAFWDNRCVAHYAMDDYFGHERIMNRVTLQGDRPK